MSSQLVGAPTRSGRALRAFETKDTTLVSQLFARDPDMVGFGTDSAEHWVGGDAMRQNIAMEIAAFDSTRIGVSDQVIKVHPSGTVAWFSELSDWDLKTGGNPVHIK